jgi:hypothetical protein
VRPSVTAPNTEEVNKALIVVFRSLLRSKVPLLIDHWQKICILSERMIKRREAAAVWDVVFGYG